MTDIRKQTLTDILKANGYSITRPRAMLFDYLTDKEPLTIQKIITHFKTSIDRASIYRTLKLFESLGVIQRLRFGWKYKIELTDKFAEHHHHLSCLQCGKMIVINESEFENFIQHFAFKNGFQATQHQIEIQGYCENCKKQEHRA
jgi:Fur family ferric uptake transcriptional regulator